MTESVTIKVKNEQGIHPRLVVKLRDEFQIPYVDGAERYLTGSDLEKWGELARRYPGITLKRLYTVLGAEEIEALVARGRETDPAYRPHNLLTYFIVDTPAGIVPTEMSNDFRQWPVVQTAYPDPEGFDPEVTPGDNDLYPQQLYLGPADVGIGVEQVWPRAGGLGYQGADGAGIRLVDMEQGWTLDHEDLVAHGATRIHGNNRVASQSHGTRVLGVICASDNELGCIGIAPGIESVDAVSYYGSTMADAMLAAINTLEFGDVLLLEAQIYSTGGEVYFPVEIADDRFDTIRLATALGFVVVEAAGNGGQFLDEYTNSLGQQILNRFSADFRDSGAIMVGSSYRSLPHSRYVDSNYGSRIDCYAWGQDVVTPDSDNIGSTTGYSSSFNRTSAASAIIAGAAVVVQGAAQANLSFRFSPWHLREILSDPLTGTKSKSQSDLIGVMPNLKAILCGGVLNLAPDVYLRDFIGDLGDPHLAAISTSPDIILRPVAVTNPQAAFGEGSSTENSAFLGTAAVTGQDNYVYVRARNRGGSDAFNLTATVFWAPVSTLLTPDLWSRVGSTGFADLPSGNLLTVAPPVTWAKADVPASGDYCFVVLLGNELDPAPEPADFLHWNNFRRFIRENNNVGLRSVSVVSNEPDSTINPGFVELPFLVPGAPDKDRKMRLRVLAKLPQGAQLLLNLPAEMNAALDQGPRMVKYDGESNRLQFSINPHGETGLRKFLFPAKSRAEVKLLACVPESRRGNEYEVCVQQIHKGELLGQLTWRLVPGNHGRIRNDGI